MSTLREFADRLFPQPVYAGFDASKYPLDLQGYNAESPIFEQIMKLLRPTNIIEVGTWKGASAVHMAKLCKGLGLASTILCVDTWLGSHPFFWRECRQDLRLQFGFPQMYFQFLANVVHSGCSDVIVPFATTATTAAEMLAKSGVEVDCIYLDSSHDEDETWLELQRFYPLLRKGGVVFGDDYVDDYKGVVRAVNRFAYENGLRIQTFAEKWLTVKPRDPVT